MATKEENLAAIARGIDRAYDDRDRAVRFSKEWIEANNRRAEGLKRYYEAAKNS